MRSRIAAVFVLAWAASILPARADMIEIKGRGVLNGKILSQDDNEVRFEDTAKNLFVVPKADVLFLEAQMDAPAASQKKASNRWTELDLRGWRYRAEHYYGITKRFVVDKTRGIRGFIAAPLDRSSADSKSKALAGSMEDLSTNLKTLNKQDRKRAAQMRGVKDDQMRASIKTKSKNKKTGNFSSLD